jgi:uncharacterized membrane protein
MFELSGTYLATSRIPLPINGAKLDFRASALTIFGLLITTSNAFGAQTVVATDLGTLGGTYSVATEVNANGQVVGYSTTAGNAATHPFSCT